MTWSWIVVMIIALVGARAHSDVEYSAEAQTRSYPLSGTLDFKLGYGQRVWGQPGRQRSWYGYVKPELKLSTAGVYNALAARLKVFPLSFLGVTVGAEGIANRADYSAYDCELHRCQGMFHRSYVEATFGVGFGGWFVFGRGRLEDWRAKDRKSGDFVEPATGLVARSEGDRQRALLAATGWQFKSGFQVLYTFAWAAMQERYGQSQTHLVLAGKKWKQWSLTVGGGTFHSEFKDREATVIGRLAWQPTDSIELF